MIQWLFPKILGGKNEREIARIRPIVSRINEIEDALQREPDEKLESLTAEWRRHLSRYRPLAPLALRPPGGLEESERSRVSEYLETRISPLRKEFPGLPARVEASIDSIERARAAFQELQPSFEKQRARYLDQILPDAYAVVKNAARRLCGKEILVTGQPIKWDMVHFDVQLIGGIALHRGLIAEMQTGEGKTLVATLPVFLNALTGLGVHLVTVNDYLAQRDSDWMGALFRSLGLTVGCIRNDMEPAARREAYACDITYGTSSEFGFDYLRDHGIAREREEVVQRGHHFAVIDEVDSILIDDARTPLIISGPSTGPAQPYEAIRPMIEQLVKRQTALCNRIAEDVTRELAAGNHTAAGVALLKLKLGQPRNRRFLRFLEDPEMRRLLEKTELDHQQGAFRKDLHTLKEQLFFVVDEKQRDADLMENGRKFLAPGDPDSFILPDPESLLAAIRSDASLSDDRKSTAVREARANFEERAAKLHGISQLLKAYCLYERDVHYVVKDRKVIIIDESTGREMEGRRWSDGLHQAVESKERVAMEKENRTYATITLQNYFRLYEKLAGMTGTAETEAAEFHDIYQLDVLPIPTHRPNRRIDENDQIFKTRREKFQAVIARTRRAHQTGQPVLIGTASVEASETLSRMLKREKIPHEVLNAKFHQQEAPIISRAGKLGAVTVATNMAGRGTDIKLGDCVAELGGLFVIGTERHSSRRVDRQLRGRCSRQGDPGRSQFFISLEDDLMRNHASPAQMAELIERNSEGKSGLGRSLGNVVEAAQRLVEQRDYKIRKRVLEYDDVMNLQRGIVYGFRSEILAAGDLEQHVRDLVSETINTGIDQHLGSMETRAEDLDALADWIRNVLHLGANPSSWGDQSDGEIRDSVMADVMAAIRQRISELPPEIRDRFQRQMILTAIDRNWQDHLEEMDELRDGVHLRSQGQKDPLVEFKNEAFELFARLMDAIKLDALLGLMGHRPR
jgi:preprotein translocase subunit SecA